MTSHRHLLPALIALLLTACSDDGGGDNDINPGPTSRSVAVVAARAPDYSSGAISLVDTAAPFAARNNLAPTLSDIVVRSGGDHYFVIERFQADRVKRYAAANPDTPVYSYSTMDAGDSQSSNPYDLLIASATKAYLLRYGSGKLWIVNPSAATEAAFKIGEIDLSAYDVDGVPEMGAGLIKNGRLYIALQRLENFASVKYSYVAVFDVASDQEVTTGGGSDGLKGIELPVRGVSRLVSNPADGSVLAIGDGGYDGNFNPLYEGGVVRINADFSTVLVVDDGSADDHPRGQIVEMTVASGSRGYFIGSTGFFGSQTLYRFDPSGATPPVAVSGYADLRLGPASVDGSGRLWLGLTADAAPGLAVLDFANGAETVVTPRIDTNLTPMNIDFLSIPAATP